MRSRQEILQEVEAEGPFDSMRAAELEVLLDIRDLLLLLEKRISSPEQQAHLEGREERWGHRLITTEEVAFTVGNAREYTTYFEEQGTVQKAEGGAVWRTFKEAAEHCGSEHSVFGVIIQSWDSSTKRPVGTGDEDWNVLTHPAVLMRVGCVDGDYAYFVLDRDVQVVPGESYWMFDTGKILEVKVPIGSVVGNMNDPLHVRVRLPEAIVEGESGVPSMSTHEI